MNTKDLAQLAHGFNFLHDLELVIDLRRESCGSYEAALASMGADLDAAYRLVISGGFTPKTTLELLLLAFHPEFKGGRDD